MINDDTGIGSDGAVLVDDRGFRSSSATGQFADHLGDVQQHFFPVPSSAWGMLPEFAEQL